MALGSSMLAMIRAAQPQWMQVLTSMLKTQLRGCAQPIERRRWSGVRASRLALVDSASVAGLLADIAVESHFVFAFSHRNHDSPPSFALREAVPASCQIFPGYHCGGNIRVCSGVRPDTGARGIEFNDSRQTSLEISSTWQRGNRARPRRCRRGACRPTRAGVRRTTRPP